MERQQLLIDTSVLIDHLRKAKKDQTVLYRAAGRHACLISTITEFEFVVGCTPKNRQFVEDVLAGLSVIPFDSSCVRQAAEIYRTLKATNQLIALPDLFIVATAIAYNLPLLTFNRNHFERIPAVQLYDHTLFR